MRGKRGGEHTAERQSGGEKFPRASTGDLRHNPCRAKEKLNFQHIRGGRRKLLKSGARGRNPRTSIFFAGKRGGGGGLFPFGKKKTRGNALPSHTHAIRKKGSDFRPAREKRIAVEKKSPRCGVGWCWSRAGGNTLKMAVLKS